MNGTGANEAFLSELEGRLTIRPDAAGIIGKTNVADLIRAVREMASSLESIKEAIENEDWELLDLERYILRQIARGMDAYLSIGRTRQRRRKGKKKPWADVIMRGELHCQSCGSTTDLTRDHIKPLSRGGSDTLDNIQILCQTCNLTKGNK